MSESIFRKKSIDRISTPENLNEYIRVPNPSIWLILTAIIIFLVGICIWFVFGRLETKLSCVADTVNGSTVIYVLEKDLDEISVGQTVDFGETSGVITEIDATPIDVLDLDHYIQHIFGISEEEWVYRCKVDATLSDGMTKATIVLESIAPMSFVIN